MTTRYSKWSVTGYLRKAYDDYGSYLGYKEPVVVVTEPGAWQWEVVLDDDGIRDFRMIGLRAPLSPAALAYVPLADLTLMARAYLARVSELHEEGISTSDSFLLSDLQPGEAPLNGRPTDEDLARAWHEIGPRTPDGTPRRDALARIYGVSPYTVDKWLKDIRQHTDLIPPARTGRGNRKPPGLPNA